MAEEKFVPFSKKQLTAITWWHKCSPYNTMDSIICDGAIRSGKTTCMAIGFVAWSIFTFNGAQFALCGKTVTSLKRNVITPVIPRLKKLGFVCEEKVSQGYIDISFGIRKNRYYLFGGRDESSASLIQGVTLAGILLDEVALMPRSFVEQAIARCSLENSKLWFNCNPDNPQHWFYKEWVQKADEKNCLYLHFLMRDNPSLSDKVIARYESLYSGAFYERFVLGRWVAANGLVYPEGANGEYTSPPPSLDGEEFYVSCDYGTVNPSSFGLWALYGTVWYRIKEYYYSSRTQGRQKTDEEYYRELCCLCGDRQIKAVIVDPSAASFIECIRRHEKFHVVSAKNDVIDGINKTTEAFRNGVIRISPDCEDTLREFGLYRWDSGAKCDAPKKENDHAMDDIRYFVSTVLYGDTDSFFVLATDRNSAV